MSNEVNLFKTESLEAEQFSIIGSFRGYERVQSMVCTRTIDILRFKEDSVRHREV